MSSTCENVNVVERKIEKYILYFTTQPRIQGYSSTVKADLAKLKQYSSVAYTSATESQWITK